MNRTLLEGQGLFSKPHKALVEKLTDVLSYPLASTSFTMQPMLQETNGQLTVTPLGALTLASGAVVTRSSDPRVYTLDDGIYLPGPHFQQPASIQSNLYRHMEEETGHGRYREW